MAHDRNSDDLRRLADTIRELAESAGHSNGLPDGDLRRLLLFMGKVCDVVEQAFREVYAVLLQIKLLDPHSPDDGRIRQLREDLQLLRSRDRYRDAEMICGRLHALREQFHHHIEPLVNQLQSGDRWRDLFRLLDDREGRVIELVQSIVRDLDRYLSQGANPGAMEQAKAVADSRSEEVRRVVCEMQDFNNGLLGLSGQEGWLELVASDRGKLTSEVALVFQHNDNRRYERNVVRADNNTGAIAVGRGNSATSTRNTTKGLTKAEMDALFVDATKEIRELALTSGAADSAIKQLDVAKEEASREKPDLEYVGKTIAKATETVKNAGGLVTATTALGKLLAPFAAWVGSKLI